MDNDPLLFVVNTVINTRFTTRTYALGLLNSNVDDIAVGMETLKYNISQSTSSRRVTHREMNPSLSVHISSQTPHNGFNSVLLISTLPSSGGVEQEGAWPPATRRAIVYLWSGTQLSTLSTHSHYVYTIFPPFRIFLQTNSQTDSCNVIYTLLSLYYLQPQCYLHAIWYFIF